MGLPFWEILVNESTGLPVNEFKTAKLRAIDFKLKPSSYDGHILIANGSIHKFFNTGTHNADQFTFSNLSQSLDSLSDIFGIPEENALLRGLEIGVNISLPFSPIRVLKNLVCYRAKEFTQIDKRSQGKGVQCALTQYRLKVYDKAKQSGVDCGHVLRVEVAIDKMQVISSHEIRTLADLRNRNKVYTLISVLTDAVKGIVWTDVYASKKGMSSRELAQWNDFSNPKTWERMSKHQRVRASKKWSDLLARYGNPVKLLPLITTEWDRLFMDQMEAENPQPFYRLPDELEAKESATFLPLECTVKTSQPATGKPIFTNTTFTGSNEFAATKDQHVSDQPKRRCLSCNRDISKQGKRSLFCSEKLYKKEGKKCRNMNSNKRRGYRRKIKSAITKDHYLQITYSSENGTIFTDILHPSEIVASKEWMDRIISMQKIDTRSDH